MITWKDVVTEDEVTKSVWASSIKSKPRDLPDSGAGSNLG